MLVIQHRVNDISLPATSDIGEIDVHIDMYGDILIKHNPDGPGWKLDYFLKKSKHKKFFVDIKQNLSVPLLLKIMRAFDKRSIGLFDVPMPSAHYLAAEGVQFYSRLSEYEKPNGITSKFWLDPLCLYTPGNYNRIASWLADSDEIIVACPSLHGHSIEVCKKIWVWAKYAGYLIEGIVTKHVEECEKVLNA